MLNGRLASWLPRRTLGGLRCLLTTVCCLLLCCGGAKAADIPTEVEKWVGRQVAELLEAEMGLTSDRNLSAWVKRIGSEVAAVSPRQDLRYEFAILDAPEQNAFALPGGYIFITLGLLRNAVSDEEVAAVLAHEVAHVSERHFTKYLAASLASYLGLTYVNQHTKATWHALARASAYLAILRLSRRSEAQADRRGLLFASEAEYDPEGLVEFFVATGGGGRRSYLDALLSTHPSNYDRIVGARGNPLLSDDDYEGLLKRARNRRRHFSLTEASILYQKAARVRPGELAAQLELASLAAERGLLLSAAAAYEALEELHPASKAEAEALRKEAAEYAPIRPTEEQIAPAKAKLDVLAGALSSGRGELEPVLKKNSAALGAFASARQVNKLMDSVLLLEPNFWDEKRLLLLAQAKAIVQSVESAVVQVGDANWEARLLNEEWSDFSEQLQKALALPNSAEALQFLRERTQDVGADGALAVPVAKQAAEDCSTALRRLDASLRSLTPLLVALVDAGMQKDAMSAAAALSLEALALRAGMLASQADRLASEAFQDCSTAFLRLRQWELELKFAQASSRARETLIRMLAYRLGVEPRQVSDVISEGLGYGQAAVVLAIASARGVAPAEVIRDGQAPDWAEVARKWRLRMDALLVPLDMLRQSAEGVAP